MRREKGKQKISISPMSATANVQTLPQYVIVLEGFPMQRRKVRDDLGARRRGRQL